MPKFTFIGPNRSRGFSLVEVCLALTVLAMVSGSIYAVLKGSIDSAAGLKESLNRQQEIDGFIGLCAQTFQELPAQGKLESRLVTQGEVAIPQLIFRGAPEVLSWDGVNDLDSVSVLGMKARDGGRFSLALLRTHSENDFADPTANAKPEDWLTLVPDVTRLSWRFFDSASGSWVDILPPGHTRPQAVELTLQLPDEPRPIRAIFNIPPLASPPINQP